MADRSEKFRRFRALHHRPGAFIIPNPWDAGTARILAALGFEALATTSAGYAFSVGRRDSQGGLDRAALLDNARAIAAATDLPVSADLEDGFGAAPSHCGETIRLAIDAGLVGGSIEDATGDPAHPIFDRGLARDRIEAAVEAARGRDFLLTARAENFLWGRPDLKDTIARLQMFSEAGADVLYAPGLPDLATIRTVCASLDRPVNVVMGLGGINIPVRDLAAAGVKRISVGGSFARAALGALIRAAEEVRDEGTFFYTTEAAPAARIEAMMSSEKRAVTS